MGGTGEATDQDMFAPPSTSDFLVEVGLTLVLGLVTSCYGCKTLGWRPAYCRLR